MEQSIVTRKVVPKKALVTKASRVNDGSLQPGGALSRRLHHDKPHWTKPVAGSVLDCKLCRWNSGENIIAQVQV